MSNVVTDASEVGRGTITPVAAPPPHPPRTARADPWWVRIPLILAGNHFGTLVKNNRFLKDGRMNLQFRSEFFNVFNRVRFGNPGLTFGNPQFGVITSQVNAPRLIQFALKLLY